MQIVSVVPIAFVFQNTCPQPSEVLLPFEIRYWKHSDCSLSLKMEIDCDINQSVVFWNCQTPIPLDMCCIGLFAISLPIAILQLHPPIGVRDWNKLINENVCEVKKKVSKHMKKHIK